MSKAITTRLSILKQAFELIYAKGFQSTSIDEIIAKTEVTKGAFFYHFKNKDEMGLAMINDVMYPGMYAAMIQPLRSSEEPLSEIYLMMKNLLTTNAFFQVRYGCPAINLIDEMAPLNETFNKALSKLVIQWQDALVACLEKAKAQKKIQNEVDSKHIAFFIMSGYSGIRNLGKIYGKRCYINYLKELKRYLEGLH